MGAAGECWLAMVGGWLLLASWRAQCRTLWGPHSTMAVHAVRHMPPLVLPCLPGPAPAGVCWAWWS